MEKISFIISTIGKSKYLNELYNFLKESKNDEIIIVDNSENNILKNKFDNNVIWEKKSGLSSARNCGAKHANNDILFFLDDDLILPKDFFDRIKKYRTIKNELIGFKITPKFIPEYLPKKYWYLVGYKNLSDKIIKLKMNQYLGGCALLMNKKLYNDIGGFNENFGHKRDTVGANEDVLFQIEALNKSYDILFDPNINIIHCWDNTFESLLNRIKIQAKNDFIIDNKSIRMYLKLIKFSILKILYVNVESKIFEYTKYLTYINCYTKSRKGRDYE